MCEPEDGVIVVQKVGELRVFGERCTQPLEVA
jgi:hypothetical protein